MTSPTVTDERSPAQFFFEMGFGACYAEAMVRNGHQPPFPLTDEMIERQWAISQEAYDDPAELDAMLARTAHSGEASVDSGMDGASVEAAELFWANLPTRRKWASLATHEKALVCHTLARASHSSEGRSKGAGEHALRRIVSYQPRPEKGDGVPCHRCHHCGWRWPDTENERHGDHCAFVIARAALASLTAPPTSETIDAKQADTLHHAHVASLESLTMPTSEERLRKALAKITFLTCVSGDGPTPYLKVHFSDLAAAHAGHDALIAIKRGDA